MEAGARLRAGIPAAVLPSRSGMSPLAPCSANMRKCRMSLFFFSM